MWFRMLNGNLAILAALNFCYFVVGSSLDLFILVRFRFFLIFSSLFSRKRWIRQLWERLSDLDTFTEGEKKLGLIHNPLKNCAIQHKSKKYNRTKTQSRWVTGSFYMLLDFLWIQIASITCIQSSSSHCIDATWCLVAVVTMPPKKGIQFTS